MKKLFAILMVAVLLFNAGGYDLFFQYMMYRSDANIFNKINSDHYGHSDLVDIKIPVHMPTQDDWDSYHEVSGQVEVHGAKYDFAEIRMTHDTLYLRAIPNPELTRLAKASTLYGKLLNDLPASNAKHPVNLLTKKSLSESEYLTFVYRHAPVIMVKKSVHNFSFSGTLSPALEVGAQPPEV